MRFAWSICIMTLLCGRADAGCPPDCQRATTGNPYTTDSGTSASGDSSGSSGSDVENWWAEPELTDEEIEAESRRRQQEREDAYYANNPTDPYNWTTTPPPIPYNSSDPFANSGPLPSGPIVMASFSGGRVPFAEVDAMDRDFTSRNAYVSEWGRPWDAFDASLAEDEHFMATLPFVARFFRKGPVGEEIAAAEAEAASEDGFFEEAKGWAMDKFGLSDRAKANLDGIQQWSRGMAGLAGAAASGRVDSADYVQVMTNQGAVNHGDLASPEVLLMRGTAARAASEGAGP